MSWERFPDRVIEVMVRPVEDGRVEARAAPFSIGERGADPPRALRQLHLWMQDGCIVGRVVYRVHERLAGGGEIDYLLPDELARRLETIERCRGAALLGGAGFQPETT